jgi:hypothetical protein
VIFDYLIAEYSHFFLTEAMTTPTSSKWILVFYIIMYTDISRAASVIESQTNRAGPVLPALGNSRIRISELS